MDSKIDILDGPYEDIKEFLENFPEIYENMETFKARFKKIEKVKKKNWLEKCWIRSKKALNVFWANFKEKTRAKLLGDESCSECISVRDNDNFIIMIPF